MEGGREAASPQRLQLEGCSPEEAHRAGEAGMNLLPAPEQEPRGLRERGAWWQSGRRVQCKAWGY